MEQLAGNDAGMQSRLNSTLVQFRNQNDMCSNLLQRLIVMRDTLTGNLAKEVAKQVDDKPQVVNIGIVPQIDDCLAVYNNQLTRFESVLNDLREYI